MPEGRGARDALCRVLLCLALRRLCSGPLLCACPPRLRLLHAPSELLTVAGLLSGLLGPSAALAAGLCQLLPQLAHLLHQLHAAALGSADLLVQVQLPLHSSALLGPQRRHLLPRHSQRLLRLSRARAQRVSLGHEAGHCRGGGLPVVRSTDSGHCSESLRLCPPPGTLPRAVAHRRQQPVQLLQRIAHTGVDAPRRGVQL